jgi:hypothetical protein
VRRLLAALVLLSAVACSAPLAKYAPHASTRPACADKVARAFVSPAVVPGAFSCLTPEEMAYMSRRGINSDDQWALSASQAPMPESFGFERRLSDGAYVYAAHFTKPADVTVDIILWVNAQGSVESFDITGR